MPEQEASGKWLDYKAEHTLIREDQKTNTNVTASACNDNTELGMGGQLGLYVYKKTQQNNIADIS